ncbi:TIGR03621 family F420-dependent LLM class oxidoreductase [Catenuloplanes atrovinosus]|uniref:F420-dependent oxidoreductase n=1 Tax=Catenuloplanes atrovinosus TaxID=137266 RepID=A0AAE3YRG3_9ACTN|nr:TIGR03621 family F420-dependent LLM class oxidoreductase [Catenuloplanes atrovinosus]MDR7277098.1 putative F420-dependent oxidoreductase [Catenuloplanes atrovinosus]
MSERPFRFGVALTGVVSRTAWLEKVRRAADLGYDVLQIPDHLGFTAPFPALVAAAEATGTMRLGTFVLNAALYRPWVLARDVADTWRLTGGRFELGLGTGYMEHEFAAAGLPFGSGAERLAYLAHTLREVRGRLAAEPDRPDPPVMLAGAGRRLLQLAGREADIVGFSVQAAVTPGVEPERALADRIAVVRAAAGDRFAGLELNMIVGAVGRSTAESDLTIARAATGLPDEELLGLPSVLCGPEQVIADRLRRYRDEFGISYYGVLEPHMTAFARVIPLLR